MSGVTAVPTAERMGGWARLFGHVQSLLGVKQMDFCGCKGRAAGRQGGGVEQAQSCRIWSRVLMSGVTAAPAAERMGGWAHLFGHVRFLLGVKHMDFCNTCGCEGCAGRQGGGAEQVGPQLRNLVWGAEMGL